MNKENFNLCLYNVEKLKEKEDAKKEEHYFFSAILNFINSFI